MLHLLYFLLGSERFVLSEHLLNTLLYRLLAGHELLGCESLFSRLFLDDSDVAGLVNELLPVLHTVAVFLFVVLQRLVVRIQHLVRVARIDFLLLGQVLGDGFPGLDTLRLGVLVSALRLWLLAEHARVSSVDHLNL